MADDLLKRYSQGFRNDTKQKPDDAVKPVEPEKPGLFSRIMDSITPDPTVTPVVVPPPVPAVTPAPLDTDAANYFNKMKTTRPR